MPSMCLKPAKFIIIIIVATESFLYARTYVKQFAHVT